LFLFLRGNNNSNIIIITAKTAIDHPLIASSAAHFISWELCHLIDWKNDSIWPTGFGYYLDYRGEMWFVSEVCSVGCLDWFKVDVSRR